VKIIKLFVGRAGHVYPGVGPALDIRQLLNPIFFERVCRHVDMKRQRSRRLRSKALVQARRLKTGQNAVWVPPLPETHAWETWFDQLGFYGWRERRNEGGWSV
jgi:hypothetical protein